MTLVSVVIPYYNRRAWLKDALASVAAQTLADHEVIVVDDGSDESAEAIDLASDSRVTVVRQEHRGVSAARNEGIRLASGTYVAFLDADDVFLPDKLEVQVAAMDADPAVPISHTSYLRMDSLGNDLDEVHSGAFGGRLYPEIVLWCPIATPTVMVRRDITIREGFWFQETVAVGEDNMLWIDYARRGEMLGIDRTLTKVRVHGHNAFTNQRSQYDGGMAVAHYAFQRDPDLGFWFRRRATASVYGASGYFFLEEQRKAKAFWYFARSAAHWPFNSAVLVELGRLVLPSPLRRALKAIARVPNACHRASR